MKSVWLYFPNLIGYLRLLLLLLTVASDNPFRKALFLTICALLDVVDGKVARFFKQSSLFGSRLDLIIDMACHLMMVYYALFFFSGIRIRSFLIFSAMNDLMQYGLILFTFYRRDTGIDHKIELTKHGLLLPIYYSRLGLGVSNVLNDAFLILSIFSPPLLPGFVLPFCFVGYLFRHLCIAEQSFRIWAIRKRVFT